jgi:hypothetical protein
MVGAMNRMRLALWVAAAAAAVGVTTAAVTVANADSGGNDVLSQDEVARQLADETATPGTPSPSPSPEAPPPTGDAEPGTLSGQAGQLVVRCDGDTAYLETWSPNPGYRVDDVVRGPAATVSVEFESDSYDDVEVVVRCQDGTLVQEDHVELDDHGGDRDDDADDDADDDHGDDADDDHDDDTDDDHDD